MTLRTRYHAALAAGLVTVVTLWAAGAFAARSARPFVRITSPAPEEIVGGPDVTVCFEAGGMQYCPGGNNLHFMLDNQPFEVQYDPQQPHVFRDVAPGAHTIRVYAANPMHEAQPYVFDYVTFSVMYPNDENRPEQGEPFLTFNLPQGEYLGIDCADITLDFFVTGSPLSRRGYHVNYYVDGRRFTAYDCTIRHIKGLKPGFHKIRMELVDEAGRLVFGPFNSVERVIMLSPEKSLARLKPGAKLPAQPELQSIHGAMTQGLPWVTPTPTPLPGMRAEYEQHRGQLTVQTEEAPQGKPQFQVRRETLGRQEVQETARPEEITGPRGKKPAREEIQAPAPSEPGNQDQTKPGEQPALKQEKPPVSQPENQPPDAGARLKSPAGQGKAPTPDIGSSITDAIRSLRRSVPVTTSTGSPASGTGVVMGTTEGVTLRAMTYTSTSTLMERVRKRIEARERMSSPSASMPPVTSPTVHVVDASTTSAQDDKEQTPAP